MNHLDRRQEPRFLLGKRIEVALKRNGSWLQLEGMTLNVSENGVLVSLAERPVVEERVRVRALADDQWSDAVVCHVFRGSSNHLVGLRLTQPRESWSKWVRSAAASDK